MTRTRTVRLRRDRTVAALGTALAAALIGFGAAPWLDAHTRGRTPLDPDRYALIVPGAASAGLSPAEAARSGIAAGHLVLETRAFGAAERLIPRIGGERLELEVLEGTVAVSARTVQGGAVELGRFGAGPLVLTVRDGVATIGEAAVARGVTDEVEIAPVESAVIGRLNDDDFSVPVPARARFVWSALLAALGAGIARTVTRDGATLSDRVALALASLPALGVLLVPYGGWVATAARLHLAGVDIGDLRRGALIAASLPLASTLLVAGRLLDLDRIRLPEPPRALLAGIGLLVLALASRGLTGAGWLLLPLGAAFLLANPWLARATGQPLAAALLRDAPAQLAVAALGWGTGLLPAVVWRFLTLAADAPRLVQRGAREGADALFALVLLLPISAELFARGTVAGHDWDPDVLAGASVSDTERITEPFWEAACPAGGDANVMAFGGSSTGGAWQFRGDPTSFFPARLHERLCAAGARVRSFNYGDGGRDTFDVAQAAPGIFASHRPDVVILYVGVNDALTRESSLTRKQRAALLAGRELGLLDRVSGASRVVTGLGLLMRPRAEAALVEAVPLADAEENVRAVAGQVAAAGGRLLLVPEVTRGTIPEITAYAAMLSRLGDALPATDAIDARDAVGDALSDRNHLTPEGADALAALLEPAVRAALEDR